MQLTDAACRIDKALLLGKAGAPLDQDGGLGMPDYLVKTIFFVGVRGEFTAETGATGWGVCSADKCMQRCFDPHSSLCVECDPPSRQRSEVKAAAATAAAAAAVVQRWR
jgi:hypothetical protein